jgi:Beta-lactamase
VGVKVKRPAVGGGAEQPAFMAPKVEPRGGRVVIGGSVAEGFTPVRAAFESNFHDRHELGASVALYRGAEPLVDLWGGYRDVAGTRPWERDLSPGLLDQQGLAGLVLGLVGQQRSTVAHQQVGDLLDPMSGGTQTTGLDITSLTRTPAFLQR